jgi:predicted dienelactone hydrolase
MRLCYHQALWGLLLLFAWGPLRCEGAELGADRAAMAPSLERFSSRGPFQVASDTSTWRDDARDRSVPIKLYYPTEADGKQFPVIVFSHGLGGSREGCAYLGKIWASQGFLSLHPQHYGSDEHVWRGKLRPIHALKSSFEDPKNLADRVGDLQFVLDSLEKHVADDTPLGQMVDMDRIGIAGHAFGSLAALGLAGQRVPALEGDESLPDTRVKAILALSSPVLFEGNDYREAYGTIRIPALHMTGTEDDSPVGATRAEHRRIPFEYMERADRFLVTFEGADHLSFSGHLRDRAAKEDPFYQSRIGAASSAFWSAYLLDAPQTRAWFSKRGLRTIVGETGRVEHKSPADRAK